MGCRLAGEMGRDRAKEASSLHAVLDNCCINACMSVPLLTNCCNYACMSVSLLAPCHINACMSLSLLASLCTNAKHVIVAAS
jgi:hypothetical protein